MYIVANLLSLISKYRIRAIGSGALAEIREEPVELRAAMAATGKAAAAKYGRPQAEVPAVFLHHDVCRHFRHAEKAVCRLVHAHALVNTGSRVRMALIDFVALTEFDER